MTLGSADYALLDQDSYRSRSLHELVHMGDFDYTIAGYADNPRTGFQATAYEHINPDGSHELVLAYRGTETGEGRRVDEGLDVCVDAGMVMAGLNAQTPDAMAFTKRVLAKAKLEAERGHYELNVTVTGHSLGGTLAQMMAYEYGLRGETFNAYGAAGLMPAIPEGGHQVINHVRATDVVSAASPHFGEVRIYATAQDVDALGRAGYTDIPLLNMLPSTHAPWLGKVQADAHGIANFVPDPARDGESLLAPANAARYREHAIMIQAYRGDIGHARAATSLLAGAAAQPLVNTLAFGLGEGQRAVRAARHVGHGIAQGLHELEQRGEAIVDGVAGRFAAFSARLDRMLAAAGAGDWDRFRDDTQALASSERGQALRAHATGMIDQQWQPLGPAPTQPVPDAAGPAWGR
ncbi:lipase family protein [Frateuria hangzhouensis]|uniref:lipase family protein n=1 Tax=Frateuria hangzhouensis TaxID=2995589 RepID=UPI002B213D9B|nr:DUF6792 domain-containing protein [Frateuria sp. STR12]